MSELLEKIDYELPLFLQECILYSDLIHMVQLNDLKNQRFDHITFIGKYSEILTQQNKSIYKINEVINSQVTSVYLEKKIDNEYLRPNHSIHNCKYNLIENKDDILNGMLKCKINSSGLQTNNVISNDFYILVNTINETEQFNVYAYTSEKSNHVHDCYYQCLVFIGKIINPAPYKIDDIENFEKINNFTFNDKFKNFITTQPKICVLHNEINKNIFYINLFGNNSKLCNEFTINKDKYDIEEFRPLLNKIWLKQLLDNTYNSKEDEEYNIIMQQIDEFNNTFFNGFIKIGTILDETNKNSKLNVDTVIELYMLINTKSDLQGSLWIFELKDDGSGKTKDDINYLPIKSMTNIGYIYK